MSAVAYNYRNEVNLSYLKFPDTYSPSESKRDKWMVETLGTNPVWVIIAAFVPAIVLTMMLFMEQHLTAMNANKKENRLKVGWFLDFMEMSNLLIVDKQIH